MTKEQIYETSKQLNKNFLENDLSTLYKIKELSINKEDTQKFIDYVQSNFNTYISSINHIYHNEGYKTDMEYDYNKVLDIVKKYNTLIDAAKNKGII